MRGRGISFYEDIGHMVELEGAVRWDLSFWAYVCDAPRCVSCAMAAIYMRAWRDAMTDDG